MFEASPVSDPSSTCLCLSLCSAVKESWRFPWPLFPPGPSENVQGDCHHYWMSVLFQETCNLFLPTYSFFMFLFSLQHFFPCLPFSWVYSSSAVQFAFQTQFWQHCWALCWPLRSTVTLTAAGAPQLFSLETTELLFVLQALVDQRNRSPLPQYLSTVLFSYQNEELVSI